MSVSTLFASVIRSTVDGLACNVPVELTETVVGIWKDNEGWVFVARLFDGMDEFYVLTACCDASGKGSADVESGVVCRACYEEVDSLHGDVFNVSNPHIKLFV